MFNERSMNTRDTFGELSRPAARGYSGSLVVMHLECLARSMLKTRSIEQWHITSLDGGRCLSRGLSTLPSGSTAIPTARAIRSG